MKLVKGYLILTSVIFHLAIAGSLYWVLPLYDDAIYAADSMVESFGQERLGIVTGKSEISQANLVYTGYSVKFEGKDLYLSSYANEEFTIGEQAQIIVYEHSRMGTLSLVALISKLEP